MLQLLYMHICEYVYAYIWVHVWETSLPFEKHVCICMIFGYILYIYTYAYVYMLSFVCMQIFTYLCIYTYTHFFFLHAGSYL